MIKDEVDLLGKQTNIKDIMSKHGTFKNGIRQETYSIKHVPALSGKLLPEFDKRRSIKDMFGKGLSLSSSGSAVITQPHSPHLKGGFNYEERLNTETDLAESHQLTIDKSAISQSSSTASQTQGMSPGKKRQGSEANRSATSKRAKPISKGLSTKGPDKSQQSLKGFLSKNAYLQEPTHDCNTLKPENMPTDEEGKLGGGVNVVQL